MSYILPGKFTTEKLEKRSGKYRLLGGCNYNVSFDEVVNAEKKIRLKHIFRKASGSSFSLSEIQKLSEKSYIESDFNWVLPQNNVVDESANIYISGYAAHKISKKLSCDMCISLVTESKGNFVQNEYFDLFATRWLIGSYRHCEMGIISFWCNF